MICKKCGAQVPEDHKFCEQCGTPVEHDDAKVAKDEQSEAAKAAEPAEQEAAEVETDDAKVVPEEENSDATGAKPAPAEENAPKEQKKTAGLSKKKKLGILLVALAVVAAGVIGGILWHGHVQAVEYQKGLETAQMYLEDQDLDKAEAACLDLIKIQPKKPEAYLTLADIYTEEKQYQKVVKTLKKGLKETGDTEKFEKRISEAEILFENSWKEAYSRVLKDNEYAILLYENGATAYSEAAGETVALCDLNEDGVPELLFFTYEGTDAALQVYTYRDGAARKMPYTWTQYWRGEDRVDSDGFHDYEVAGGYEYIVWKEKDRKGMTICDEIIDETINIGLSRYTWEDNALKGPDLVSYGHLLVNYPDNQDPEYTYWKNGAESTKEEYEKRRDEILENVEQVIFASGLDKVDDMDDEYQKIWGSVSSAETLAVPYAEALKQLKTKKAPKSKDSGNTAGTDPLFEKLDGMSFSFSSGAGAWYTEVQIASDGTFTGRYQDDNMGEDMENYPGGTRYLCDFSGKFKDVKKAGDHAYTMTLDGDLKLDKKPETDEEIDQQHVIYTEAYGMENLKDGSTVTILEPGYDMTALNEETRSWIALLSGEQDAPATAETYYLYNEDGGDNGYIFIGYGEEE